MPPTCPSSPDRLAQLATVADLLEQNAPPEDVQHLAGLADPRTTRLYDRQRRKVTRNIVERISIRLRLRSDSAAWGRADSSEVRLDEAPEVAGPTLEFPQPQAVKPLQPADPPLELIEPIEDLVDRVQGDGGGAAGVTGQDAVRRRGQ